VTVKPKSREKLVIRRAAFIEIIAD